MIKPIISSPIVKNAIVGTIMLGAVAAGATTKTSQNENSAHVQYTEVASKQASEGTKLLAFASTPTAGTVRNRSLDSKIMALAENDAERAENKAYLDNTYNKYGTFGATVDVQLLLDDILIDQTLTKYLNNRSEKLAKAADLLEKNGEPDSEMTSFMLSLRSDIPTLSAGSIRLLAKNTTANVENLKQHFSTKFARARRQEFGNMLAPQAIAQNGKPSFETASKYIDESAKTFLNTKAEQDAYFGKVKQFSQKQGTNLNDEQKANLLSYKVFLLDALMIKKTLNTVDFFKNNKEFDKVFDKEFLSKMPR